MYIFATDRQRLARIVGWDDAGISGGRGEGSSRAILATARPSCYFWFRQQPSAKSKHTVFSASKIPRLPGKTPKSQVYPKFPKFWEKSRGVEALHSILMY